MADTAHAGPYGGQPSSGASAGGGGMKDQAQEKAQEVKDQAKQQAHEVAGQAKSRVSEQVDERSTQAGQRVQQQASDIRSVGEQLRSQGKDGPAKVADQAADRIDKVGNWLTSSSGDDILHDIEDFGRRQPWAVMAGGVALGFLASRFLKASSRDRYERRYSSGYDNHRTGYTNELYGTRQQLPESTGVSYGTGVGTTGVSTGGVGTGGVGTGGVGTGTTPVGAESEERFRRAGDADDPLRPPAGSGGV